MIELRPHRMATLAAVSTFCLAGPLAAQVAESDSIAVVRVAPIVVSVSRVEEPVSEAASSVSVAC